MHLFVHDQTPNAELTGNVQTRLCVVVIPDKNKLFSNGTKERKNG